MGELGVGTQSPRRNPMGTVPGLRLAPLRLAVRRGLPHPVSAVTITRLGSYPIEREVGRGGTASGAG